MKDFEVNYDEVDKEKREEYDKYARGKILKAIDAQKPSCVYEKPIHAEAQQVLDGVIQATDELLKEMEEQEKKAFENFRKARFSEESKKKFFEQIADITDKRGFILGQRGMYFFNWTAALRLEDLKKYTEIMEPRMNVILEQSEKFDKLCEMKVEERKKYAKGSEEWKKCTAEISVLQDMTQFRQIEHIQQYIYALKTLQNGESPWVDRERVQSGDRYVLDSIRYGKDYADKARAARNARRARRGREASLRSPQPDNESKKGQTLKENEERSRIAQELETYLKKSEETSHKEPQNKSDSLTKGSHDENTQSVNYILSRIANRIENVPDQEDKALDIGRNTAIKEM